MDHAKSPHTLENGGPPPNSVSGRHHLSKNLSKGWRLFARFLDFVEREATFFRIHLAAFTFIPLICSGIFYASNGRYPVSFLDSMFLCYSSMTVTGLTTVNLSTLTTWQQVMMYFLMIIGDITMISWTMVLVRKHYFRTHCEYIITKRRRSQSRSRASIFSNISSPIQAFKAREAAPRQDKTLQSNRLANPDFNVVGPTPGGTLVNNSDYLVASPTQEDIRRSLESLELITDAQAFSASPKTATTALSPADTDNHYRSPPVVGFDLSTSVSRASGRYPPVARRTRVPTRGATMLRRQVSPYPAGTPGVPDADNRKYHNFGGYPGPAHIMHAAVRIAAPHLYKKMERKMTVPASMTLDESAHPWLKFSGLVVSRNSDFHTETLSDEQLEHIGGAEYRALRLLSYAVPSYFVLCQMFAVILFLPWLTLNHSYDGVFAAQPKLVPKPWFAFFQVMGAYTGGGLSLCDMGMVPFQDAYLLITALMFVILAGNSALPIFFRFVFWVSHKVLPKDSEHQVALSFLLEHPRRCFLYLFPSHQTWFLLLCLVVFSAIEWVAFLVLNIGLPAYESIATGPRVLAGLFQGLAARASGFSIVPLASLAPALQFLYVVMMYIAVYPVAISIRSTNTYEERSLGVFEAPPDDEDEEPDDINKLKTRRERIGRYVGWHVRRQMSIDIWWLVWGVFIVAIIERKNLVDESMKWFDLFRILFEMVSAFGGIGLSLGIPTENYSFVGAMSPLSKLVVIVIMVRGRHRGLPVAVDRAVLLPNELITQSNVPIMGNPPPPNAPSNMSSTPTGTDGPMAEMFTGARPSYPQSSLPRLVVDG